MWVGRSFRTRTGGLTKMRTSSLALIGLLLGTTLACSSEETVSSENIRTKGIAALIEAKAENDSSTKIRAELLVGGDESNTHVILDSGDKITVEGGSESQTLQAESEGIYTATFGTGAADTEFKVMLERPDDDDALGNVGKLPAPFTLGALPSNTPSRANDDFDVTWDAGTSDNMWLEIEGSCIFEEKIENVPDTGSYTVKAGKLDSTGGSNPETCDITVRLWRENSGAVDSILDNESWYKLRQVRSAKFTSAP